ncbi:MAG: arabinan endo-1,5-alpha-L-arabinosidase, partial [Phycisphaerales bacterium]|nr:arabinan endo-1,5-alpha-L-arabinosidase [Phycisphaerales bacterium]
PIWRSKDLAYWEWAGQVYQGEVPLWARVEVPEAHDVWAPEISYDGKQYILTFAISTFGSWRSVIGVATAPKIDPAAPWLWRDLGPIVESNADTPFNAIDPCIVTSSEGGKSIVFGSQKQGIMLADLDPKSLTLTSEPRPIAARPDGSPMEAPYLVQRNGWWYLFVSYDACCKGVESTYNVRVGRSKSIAGPYVDHQNRPMLKGGGMQILRRRAPQAGPGHCSVLERNGQWYIAHHYYDMNADGRRTLSVRPIEWVDDWPRPGEPITEESAPKLGEAEGIG